MPRPQKSTVEYFQHYVKRGKTIFTLESRFSNDGYAFWFKTLELLGETENHFINCKDEALWEYYLTITNVSEQKANDILNLLSKLNAIDSDLWNLRIVWSENFIRNLSVLYNKRTVQPPDKQAILRISGAEIPNIGNNRSYKPHSIVEYRIEEDSIDNKPDELSEYELNNPPPLDNSQDKEMIQNNYPLLYPFYDYLKSNMGNKKLIPLQPAIGNQCKKLLNDLNDLCIKTGNSFEVVLQSKLASIIEKLEHSKCPMNEVIKALGWAIEYLQGKQTKAEADTPTYQAINQTPPPMSEEELISRGICKRNEKGHLVRANQ